MQEKILSYDITCTHYSSPLYSDNVSFYKPKV